MKGAPTRRPDVEVDAPRDGKCTVMDLRGRRYFRLGEREAAFYESLDGERSVDALRQAGLQGFTAQQVDTLLEWLAKHDLLEDESVMPLRAESVWARAWRGMLHPDRWRIRLGDPDAFLDSHRRLVDALFSRQALGLYLVMLLAPVIFAGVAPGVLHEAFDAYRLSSNAEGIVVLVVMVIAMNVIHEMAHAVACKHYGGRVHLIGVMFFYLYPVMYCDVSDAWRFESKRTKILVSLAGLFSQAILASLASTAWLIWREPVLLHFVMVNLSIAVFNFFPFVKLDGYWMLVHAVDEPALKRRGLQQVDRVVRLAMRRNNEALVAYRPWVLAFGVGHALSVPLFWGMGIYTLYRYGGMLCPSLGGALAGGAAAIVLVKVVRAAKLYVADFRRSREVLA